MQIFRTLRNITNHPLNRSHRAAAMLRWLRWQIASRLLSGTAVMPFTNQTRLIVRRGMTGATGNIYCGLHEFEDMAFLLHVLRPDDTFVDVGANVGSYTVLASGEAGARSISIEPVPETFQHLLDNIFVNRLHDRVIAHNCAIGSAKGTVRFTVDSDTKNHVVVKTAPEIGGAGIAVRTLDEILSGESPRMLKIDVEGFEAHVIQGASGVLAGESLWAIVMELAGCGTRYGCDDETLHRTMVDYGFRPFRYEPARRKLTALPSRNPSARNTLYLRNTAQVHARVSTAAAIELPWCSV
jgi:FkbM family methyltransferase